MDSVQLRLWYPFSQQVREYSLVLRFAAYHADILRFRGQRPFQHDFVALMAVGDDNYVAGFIHFQFREDFRKLRDYGRVCLGESLGIGEFLPKPITSKSVEVAGGQVASGDYTFRERLGHIRRFCDLAAKHDVTIDFHESSGRQWGGGTYGGYGLLSKIAAEYSDVPVIICHGGGHTEAGIKAACSAAGRENVYLECGDWPAEYFEIALKNPNIGITQVIWGHDYGNVPQYITAHPGEKYHPASYPTLRMRKFPLVPTYQTDFWGWSLHQIHKIRDWVTQDEINLILGGNAAKIFKLSVPHPRMFPEGRPDIWGIHWEKSIPFLPTDQIQNPDKPYRW